MSERNYMEVYEQWVNNPLFGQETKDELLSIKDDPKEIEERFYCDLVFGTAGLRGIIGAGTNRMNKYVVRKATQGLANYIIKQGKQDKGVGRKDSNLYALIPFAARHNAASMENSGDILLESYAIATPLSVIWSGDQG